MATKVQEVRLGRNFIRPGDPVKVKLPGKTQFTSGWTVKEVFEVEGVPHLRVERERKWRLVVVSTNTIKRVAVTKAGERKR